MKKRNKSQISNIVYCYPRYWPLLSAFVVLRILSWMPFPIQLKLGRLVGRVLMRMSQRRYHIAHTNIRLCFPELSDAEQKRLVRKHFESLGMSLFEMAMTWWAADRRIKKIPVTIEGATNLDAGLAKGKGVIFLGSHYTTMDIGVRLIIVNLRPPIYMTYRPHNDPILDKLITANRVRHGLGAADYNDVRSMIRTLKQNNVMWYAPDQGYRGKLAEFIPFFGIPVSTHTTTSRMAKITGAAVVPFYVRRGENDEGYIITICPPLEDFPSDDVIADISRCNALLEANIRLAPEQYLWVHRRFKHLPPGRPDVYGERNR